MPVVEQSVAVEVQSGWPEIPVVPLLDPDGQHSGRWVTDLSRLRGTGDPEIDEVDWAALGEA